MKRVAILLSLLVLISAFGAPGFSADNAVKAQGNFFTDNGSNYIFTGAVKVQKALYERYTFGGKVVVDAISAATPRTRDFTQPPKSLPGSTLDERRTALGGFVGGYTAADTNGFFSKPVNFSKGRAEASINGSAEIRESKVSGGYINSYEERYKSQTLYGTFEQNFAMRNFTAAVTYYHNFDEVNATDAWVKKNLNYPKPKSVEGLNIGLTQILSRRTIGLLVGGMSHQHGALSDPERDVFYTPGNDVWGLEVEKLPNRRERYAAAARAIQYLWTGSSLEAGYRYYTDTWGIKSHAGDGQWSQYMAPWLLFQLRGRLYNQGESDYTNFAVDPEKDKYYSASPNLQAFNSTLVGAKITLIDNHDWIPEASLMGSLGADRYSQNAREGVANGYEAMIGHANLTVKW